MSSETFTTAMFLIAAIISAGVLINAVFPVVYTLAGTIASSSHHWRQVNFERGVSPIALATIIP